MLTEYGVVTETRKTMDCKTEVRDYELWRGICPAITLTPRHGDDHGSKVVDDGCESLVEESFHAVLTGDRRGQPDEYRWLA